MVEKAANKSYDRHENETIKAYAAFCIYRDLGANRTLDRAAAQFYPGTQPAQGRHRNKNQLGRWSAQYNWVDRCKDYDRDKESDRRAIKSEADRDAYIKDLETYQLQQKSIGTAALNFTARSIRAIDYVLHPIYKAIENKEPLTRDQIYTLFNSQLAGKNAIAIGTAGGELTAKGLAVEELMKHVQNEIDALES